MKNALGVDHPHVAFWCEKCERQVQNVIQFGAMGNGYGFAYRVQCHGQFEAVSVNDDQSLRVATQGQPLTVQVFKKKARKRKPEEPNVTFYCDKCGEMTDDWLWQRFDPPGIEWEETGKRVEHHFMVRCHGRLCGGQKQVPVVFKGRALWDHGCWKSKTPILLPMKAWLLGKVEAKDFSQAAQPQAAKATVKAIGGKPVRRIRFDE